MRITKKVAGIVAIILILIGIVAFSFSNKFEGKLNKRLDLSEYSVEKKWELPKILEEVSGIAFYKPGKLAAIQDEDGIIFLYDLKTNSIEGKINFAGSGDYEAISIVEKDAYVLRSDGHLFEVKDFLNQPKVSKYNIKLNHTVNFEGLCRNKTGDKLFMITKDEGVENGIKNVYAFNLKSRKFEKNIPFRLETEKGIFTNYEGSFKPSEIEINPKTGEFYVLDGKNPRLLILNDSFQVTKFINLNKDEFGQPEGLSFDNEGKLYISNEAGKKDANILQVKLKY